MDLVENSENNLVTATFELPGLRKDQVNVEIHEGNLTVSGGAIESSESQEGQYIIQERRLGKFSRTIKLPEGTNVSFFISPTPTRRVC